MTDLQLYLAIGLPIVANTLLFLLFQSNVHRLLDGFRSEINARFDGLNGRFEGINARFEGQNQSILRLEQKMDAKFAIVDAKFDAQMQALLRVEQVMDARLHLLENK